MSTFATPFMRQRAPAAESDPSPNLQAVQQAPFDQMLLNDLRAGAIRTVFILVLLIGMGMAFLIGFENPIAPRDLTMGLTWRTLTLLVMVTPVAAWIVQRYDYRISVWLLTLGCAITIVIAQQSYPTTIVITGLAFLVALIALFIGKWASVVAAAGSTVTLWWLATSPS